MTTNRRQFLAGGIGTLAGMTCVTPDSDADDPDTVNVGQDQAVKPCCLDYGLSFITNPAKHNAVRFWVESRTTLIDDASGGRREFYQCASCKSEHTFAEKNLFIEDNYDFLPILGEDQWLIFRRPARLSDRYRDVRNVEDVWGKPKDQPQNSAQHNRRGCPGGQHPTHTPPGMHSVFQAAQMQRKLRRFGCLRW